MNNDERISFMNTFSAENQPYYGIKLINGLHTIHIHDDEYALLGAQRLIYILIRRVEGCVDNSGVK